METVRASEESREKRKATKKTRKEKDYLVERMKKSVVET